MYSTMLLLLLALAGILTHNLNKIDDINRKTNGGFHFGPFFQMEWPSIMKSVIFVGICTVIRGELENWEPLTMNAMGLKTGGLFALLGYFSQSIMYKLNGKSESFNKPDTNGKQDTPDQ